MVVVLFIRKITKTNITKTIDDQCWRILGEHGRSRGRGNKDGERWKRRS